MENTLSLFATLCCDNWCSAIIAHNFYSEALSKTRGKGNYVSTFDTIDLSRRYGYSLERIEYSMVQLEEGREILRISTHKNMWEDNTKYEYTLNCQNVREKLDFCLQEIKKVDHHNRRALTLNHPATLTTLEWMIILSYHRYKCAYCRTNKYEVLEHYIPLTFSDSGTTKFNCVPACTSCNRLKGPYHPERMPKKLKIQFENNLANAQETMRELWHVSINGDKNTI